MIFLPKASAARNLVIRNLRRIRFAIQEEKMWFSTYADISNVFIPTRKYLLFFIKDAKNNRNWSNLCCRKTRLKNITNPQLNRFESNENCIFIILITYEGILKTITFQNASSDGFILTTGSPVSILGPRLIT